MNLFTDWANRFRALPRWMQWTAILFFLAVVIVALITSGDISPADADVTNPASAVGLMINITLRLAVVLLLIYVAAMVFRDWKGIQVTRTEHQLALLETLQLSPRRALHVVKFNEQVLLLGATDQSITLLASKDAAKQGELDTNPAKGVSFASVLASQAHEKDFIDGDDRN